MLTRRSAGQAPFFLDRNMGVKEVAVLIVRRQGNRQRTTPTEADSAHGNEA